MPRSSAAPSTDRNGERRRRSGPFRIWLLCAIPWLAIVAAFAVYDHDRAIGLMAEAAMPDGIAAFGLQWMAAAAAYAGPAISFYGLLPLGLTFVLFVLFLPWAIPWAQGGEYED